MKSLHAREERTPHGTYRPNILLYWLGRLVRPVVAEAMRQHNHNANRALWRMSRPDVFKSQDSATPQSSPERPQ